MRRWFWMIVYAVEASVRGIFQCNILWFTWRERCKPRKPLMRIASHPSENRTRTSQVITTPYSDHKLHKKGDPLSSYSPLERIHLIFIYMLHSTRFLIDHTTPNVGLKIFVKLWSLWRSPILEDCSKLCIAFSPGRKNDWKLIFKQ